MDQAGDDVLPGATLAMNQHGNVGSRYLRQLRADRQHGLGMTEDDVLRWNFAE